MKILIDENKYLTCFCIDAELENGIEVAEPDDLESFIDTFSAYKYEDGNLILDEQKLQSVNDICIADELRFKREKTCFPIINRGELWYSRLTADQKKELDAWYQAWLDVTDTKVLPDMPAWLN
jgi:hypothetical protein